MNRAAPGVLMRDFVFQVEDIMIMRFLFHNVRSLRGSDLLGLDPKSPRIGSNVKLYFLRQVFSQTRKKLSLR